MRILFPSLRHEMSINIRGHPYASRMNVFREFPLRRTDVAVENRHTHEIDHQDIIRI